MIEFARVKKRGREISLVPLIDVALFLLIFFMVAGSVEKFEIIPVDPPQAKSGRLLDEGHMVILIGAREEIIIDDELSSLEELDGMIRTQLKANPDKVLTVKADASIPARRMLAIMDKIKLAGGKNLSLVTQSNEAGQ